MIKTKWSLTLLFAAAGVAAPLQAQTFTKPPTTSPTIWAPTWLNAASDLPARVWVNFPQLADAAGYRISRALGGGSMVPVDAFARSQVYAANSGVQYPHVLPSDDSVQWYGLQVSAFFLNGTDTTWSGPSPIANVRSVPNRPPAKFEYSVTRSSMKSGFTGSLFSVTLRWQKWYPGVRGYKVRISRSNTVVAEWSAIPNTLTSVTVDAYRTTNEALGQLSFEIGRFQQTTICVCTIWPTSAAPFSPWACTAPIN